MNPAEKQMSTSAPLEILYQQKDLIAVNKPHGLLVHPSQMARDAKEFALQKLRDQLGQKVYPCHRLDRKTSGVLLFALNPEVNRQIQRLFQERKMSKTYHALVRGFMDPEGMIDYPLAENEKTQDAQTQYRLIRHFEIALPFGKFSTSRYSWVELKPLTGRFHQLRKHMAHIRHPIIGDRPHGCNKQNRLWKERFNMTKMLLHAEHLSFDYPEGNAISIKAPKSPVFQKTLTILEREAIPVD